MKYLLISLSMLICSYTVHSLEESEFSLLIDNIKQNKFDVVETYLAEERATTGHDYTVLEAIRIAQDNLRFPPNQLDIHFGIASIAQNIGEHSVMADQLISMLKTSKEIDNKWQWGKVGSMEGDPEEFMIQGLLPRTAMLFRLESEEGDRLLINVSEALIQYYPNKVYGYANLGSLYGATKRYDGAREYYLETLEIHLNYLQVNKNIMKNIGEENG